MVLTHRVEGTPEVHNHTHCAFVLWLLKPSHYQVRGKTQGHSTKARTSSSQSCRGWGDGTGSERVLCKHKDLSSSPGTHVERQAWLHTPAAQHCGSTDGSQTGFRFSEQPCLERIRQRVVEQITQRPPLVSVGTHTCAYTLHVYRTYMCHIYTLICIHTYI